MSNADDKANAPASPSTPAATAPASNETPPRESISLKRGREGSVDPQAAPVAPIPPKKNRLEGDVLTRSDTKDSDLVADVAETPGRDNEAHSDEDSNGSAKGDGEPAAANKKEGQTVKEVRRKVEEMNWKEGEKPNAAAAAPSEEKEEEPEKKSEEGKDDDWVQVDKSEAKDDEESTLKRKAEVDAEGDKKRKSTSSSPFAAAAASSSPFGAAAAKPNALDSGSSTPNALDTAAKKPSAFGSSGFGSFASTSSPFAKKPSTTEEKKTETSTSFGDILKEKGDAVEEKKIQLDKQDIPTGEEEEDTIYQTRCKLYALDDQGGWRERGVGNLKLNKHKATEAARLVMRSEGVLRVILNASLYVGMTCLEDGKHVRTTVFEGKDRTFITIRVAAELASAIHEHTPLQSKANTKSPSPQKTTTTSAEDAV
ncbi:hypothetical protein A1Q1_04895 [Trichosporon asahii var. asahii CBS 2479]|uniref:RanBD1 domain-containing protein n=1 Tax=Trichosporon asahii var. asahii (strain ATCC 90039 / CBS 2479 / JCM 2466 / KCTC 7840 / NBRC 103889/ NCYC 2677 / UAMH 7654) TaxID=1186058 RepID=J5SMV6_TRIAS|nr:hypothetical protein A1Q1_04895 [Trichosporon asahii var. asahii CBS 2479]EJT46501.1 hypothetical protein A1Q1_04895 [Trichosporon asahii var. asahii CBS 2479]